jgi:hypothetical protein
VSRAESRGTAAAAIVLAGAGALLLLAGAAGVVAGLAFADRIHAMLPAEITLDAPAIGGAALALGGALLLTGAVHEGVAVAIRSGRWLVAGIVLCAVMAALAVGWAATALVSAVAGTAPAAAMLPAGIGLGVVAVAYGWAAGGLMRARRAGQAPN